MKIVAHRGQWTDPVEKNSVGAFKLALENGFGIETDFRDSNGNIVISHDPPLCGAMNAKILLELWREHASSDAWLAINIKSDGLQRTLLDLLSETPIDRYYVFDMSIPDTRSWLQHRIPYFVRQSDIEPQPVLLENAKGVWLDAFETNWWTTSLIEEHLDFGRHVCVVSPELHGRAYPDSWQLLHPIRHHPNLMLCTDQPAEARRFFNESN